MKVFNTYLKVLKTLIAYLIIYPAVFFTLNMVVNVDNNSSEVKNFEDSKPSISIINRSDDNDFVVSFSNYLKDRAEIVELEDNNEALNDAIFYRQVSMVVIIDENFKDRLLNNENLGLEVLKVPDDNESMYIENLINNYLNTFMMYMNSGIEQDKLVGVTEETLLKSVDVSFNYDTVNSNYEPLKYYYNFTYYILSALCMAFIGMVMAKMKDPIVKRRTMCAPISNVRYNFEILIGNLCVAFGFWLLFVLGSFWFYANELFSINGLLFIINSLCILMPIIAFSLLIGNLVKNLEVQNAIQNVVALGTSFLCGVFVPQMFLGDAVLSVAKIFPPYWYVLANEKIAVMEQVNLDSVMHVIVCMVIQVVFAIAIYIIMNVIQKRRVA